jgi:hypothetical protein
VFKVLGNERQLGSHNIHPIGQHQATYSIHPITMKVISTGLLLAVVTAAASANNAL